ncbi:MAG: hypothetical protein ABEJ24_04580 [Candidatus Magasanikbacteria bacterium]
MNPKKQEDSSRQAYETAKKQQEDEDSNEEIADELEELSQTNAGQKEGIEVSESEEKIAENLDKTRGRTQENTRNITNKSTRSALAEIGDTLDIMKARKKVEKADEEKQEEPETQPTDVIIELPDDVDESVETFTEETAKAAEAQGKDTESFIESFQEQAKKPFSALGDLFESGRATVEKANKKIEETASKITNYGKTAIDKVAGFLESNEPAEWFTKDEYTLPGELSSQEKKAAEAEAQRIQARKEKFENITEEWLEEVSESELESTEEIKGALSKLQENLQNIFEPSEYTTPEEGEGELTPTEKRRAEAEAQRIQARKEKFENITEEWLEEVSESELESTEEIKGALSKLQENLQNIFEPSEYTTPEEEGELTEEERSEEGSFPSQETLEEYDIIDAHSDNPEDDFSPKVDEEEQIFQGDDAKERISDLLDEKSEEELLNAIEGLDKSESEKKEEISRKKAIINEIEKGSTNFVRLLDQISRGEQPPSFDEDPQTLKYQIAYVLEDEELLKEVDEYRETQVRSKEDVQELQSMLYDDYKDVFKEEETPEDTLRKKLNEN